MRRINIASPQFGYDGEDAEGFRSGIVRLGKLLGAKESGISVYEIPPGQSICPYHYEVGEEEWLLVLEGTPTLRDPEVSEVLGPWDVVLFPRGPEGAHGVGNETEKNVRVLMFSTVIVPTATVYPDSDKIGIWTGNPDDDVMVRKESKVDYYDGER
jgi:uncharacterized cupin superfamily protein